MRNLAQRAETSLKDRSGWFPIMTCILGIVANATSECIGSQMLQTIPALAAMSGDGLSLGAITMELGANTLGALFIIALCVTWELCPRPEINDNFVTDEARSL
jgi:hypothetical protein